MEKKIFYSWVLRKGALKLAWFILQKALYRVKTDLSRDTCVFYPEEIRRIAPFSFRPERIEWALDDSSVKGVLGGALTEPLDGERIDWTREYEDPEETEALHRWNFMLKMLSEGAYEREGLARWVEERLIEWTRLFSDEVFEEGPVPLRWESYTVGERISNTVLFYHLIGKRPPEVLMNSLCGQVRFLVQRLEYRGKRTCNHVFNNARAIYLAGVAFNVPEWRSFAGALIRREQHAFVTPDGFLRESSSHYQFLFTRWLLEVRHFAELGRDRDLLDATENTAKALIKGCRFFLVRQGLRCDMPRFGDISPDFPPEWLIDMPWSSPARRCLSAAGAPPEGNGTWASLFGTLIGTEEMDLSSGKSCQAFSESGWYRFDVGPQALFFRVEPAGPPAHAGHHHNDLFHFCLFYMGAPVLVDSGRLNYMASDPSGLFGVSPEAHNAFTIDGIGAAPSGWNSYPTDYSRFANSVDIREEGGGYRVKLTSTAFTRLGEPVWASRTFFITEKAFTVIDRFEGVGSHEVKTYFHWDSAVVLSREAPAEWRLSAGAGRGRFRSIVPLPITVREEKGECWIFGRVVLRYGLSVEAPAVEFSIKARLPIEARYEMEWGDS